MTCIVGIEHDDKVYIGGDSAGTGGWNLTVRADEKVFRNGPFVMGFTSSFRMGQLLRHALSDVPEQATKQTNAAFMCTTFIDAVRACLKAGGFAAIHNGVETGGTFLVGYRGNLYGIYDDFQVGRAISGQLAVGCGDAVAMGALCASALKDPRAKLRQALQIAEDNNGGVRGPFRVVSA